MGYHGSLQYHCIGLSSNVDEKAVKDKDVTFVRREGNSTVWSVPSGNYHFRLAWTLLQVKPCRYRGRSVPIRTSFFPECHGATIVELKNGDLVASFFGGTKERNPDCCIWVCRKPKGATEWSAPYLAADGVFSLDDPQAVLAGITAESTPADAGPVASTFKGDKFRARRKACWNPVLSRSPAEI